MTDKAKSGTGRSYFDTMGVEKGGEEYGIG